MKNIKMIVTDLDGTYLRTDKTISEYSRKIIVVMQIFRMLMAASVFPQICYQIAKLF